MDVFAVPNDCSENLLLITLPNPKDNAPTNFLYDEQNLRLYEIVKYDDQFRSWFLDNNFCKNAHMNLLTKVDPLFMFLPHLIRYASDRFRTIHDICSTFAESKPDNLSKLDFALSPDIKWSLTCEIKEIDDELFVKFSEERTINWLLGKHQRTMDALAKETDAFSTSKATLISYAQDLIDVYVPEKVSADFKKKVREQSFGPSHVESTKPAPQNKPTKRKSDTLEPASKGVGIAKFFGKKNV